MNRSPVPRTFSLVPRRAAIVLVATAAVAWASAARPAAAQVRGSSARCKVAVSDARRAMAKRELDDASTALKRASGNARTKQDKAEVARLRSMLDHLGRFWRFLAKGTEEMKAGTEIKVTTRRRRKTEMTLVGSVAGGVRLEVGGAARLFTWKTMPTELVLALADKALDKNKVAKVSLGAFLAMDEKGDRQQARKLWEEAARSGIDVSELLAELATPEDAGDKLPVPKEDLLAEAEEAVRKTYRRLYARSDVESTQKELARKLLAAGARETDDNAKRFVMLREARNMAALAGDLRMATSAIERTGEVHEVDMLKMKIEMLRKAAEGAKGPRQFRDVVLLCLNLADEAMRARRTAEARAAFQVATEAARKSKSRTLISQVAAAKQKLGSGRR